jgi:hypothetical protein
MGLSWLIVCATSAGVLWLCLRTANGRPILLWFICNLFLFTPMAWENWLWGIGLTNVLPAACLVAAIVAVESKLHRWARTGIAMLCCTVATFSLGNGLLLWPLVGMLLAWSNSLEQLKSKQWMLLAWFAGFLINVALYLPGYHLPSHPSGGSDAGGGMLHAGHSLLAFLGGPLATNYSLGFIATGTILGAMILALLFGAMGYFVWLWMIPRDYELCHRMLIWLAMAGFAMLSGITVVVFRNHLSVDLAMSSRYCPCEVCLLIALVNLVPMIIRDIRQRRPMWHPWWDHVPPILTASLILLQLQTIPMAMENAEKERLVRLQWKAAVLLSKLVPDNAVLKAASGADLPRILKVIDTLNEMGYLHPPVIADPNAAAIEDKTPFVKDNLPLGKLEQFGKQGGVEGRLAATGWAVCPRRGEPADVVFLTYENELGQPVIFTAADLYNTRQDVALAQQNLNYAQSGWVASFPIAALRANLPQVKISAWELDAETGKAARLEGVASAVHQ